MQHKKHLCQICEKIPARYIDHFIYSFYISRVVTVEDAHAPDSPYFWCQACFEQFHYDEEGNPIYEEFKHFPYRVKEDH